MKVLVLPEVSRYLYNLSLILYQKEYFSYLDSAKIYVKNLLGDIETTLPNRQKRNAPLYFERYGRDMYYSLFRTSKHTQWYVFFNIYEDKGELIYLVRYISNNHMIAQYL